MDDPFALASTPEIRQQWDNRSGWCKSATADGHHAPKQNRTYTGKEYGDLPRRKPLVDLVARAVRKQNQANLLKHLARCPRAARVS